MKHSDIWGAIDAFAKSKGKTVSGLARFSGLDATTFNPSKRFTKVGQERWPSTNSISKVLIATNSSFLDLFRVYLKKLKSDK
ncbi:MAG: hypothetical protein FWD33_03275 [Alphaproteobacteria bacterium]|nr:hypothetical protein [Alphaproteobacteria bacterium]